MLVPNLMILYVESPQKSAVFYEKLFDCAPAAVFPTYAAFEFDNGLNFGLWSTQAESFKSGGTGHRGEISFMVSEETMVRSLYEKWQATSIEIEQPLHEAVFGLTFVALDPDGHRIRVCMPDD